jgi:hypothetical protein
MSDPHHSLPPFDRGLFSLLELNDSMESRISGGLRGSSPQSGTDGSRKAERRRNLRGALKAQAPRPRSPPRLAPAHGQKEKLRKTGASFSALQSLREDIGTIQNSSRPSAGYGPEVLGPIPPRGSAA